MQIAQQESKASLVGQILSFTRPSDIAGGKKTSLGDTIICSGLKGWINIWTNGFQFILLIFKNCTIWKKNVIPLWQRRTNEVINMAKNDRETQLLLVILEILVKDKQRNDVEMIKDVKKN